MVRHVDGGVPARVRFGFGVRSRAAVRRRDPAVRSGTTGLLRQRLSRRPLLQRQWVLQRRLPDERRLRSQRDLHERCVRDESGELPRHAVPGRPVLQLRDLSPGLRRDLAVSERRCLRRHFPHLRRPPVPRHLCDEWMSRRPVLRSGIPAMPRRVQRYGGVHDGPLLRYRHARLHDTPPILSASRLPLRKPLQRRRVRGGLRYRDRLRLRLDLRHRDPPVQPGHRGVCADRLCAGELLQPALVDVPPRLRERRRLRSGRRV